MLSSVITLIAEIEQYQAHTVSISKHEHIILYGNRDFYEFRFLT